MPRDDGHSARPAGGLKGRTVVVTAGPTRERLDPVRFLSNPSTGKMGFALAEAALRAGAETILITGPTHLGSPAGASVVRVESALELREAVMSVFDRADVVISAAAVADFRPKVVADRKIKKSRAGDEDGGLVIELTRNPDILAELGRKKGGRVLVGFAAETDHVLENASEKLRAKNLDLIVANDVTREDSGFASDTNTAILIAPDLDPVELPRLAKAELAERIVSWIIKRVVGIARERGGPG